MNSSKLTLSLEETWNNSSFSSVASDNAGSECNNKFFAETDGFDNGSVKPSSPSGMHR